MKKSSKIQRDITREALLKIHELGGTQKAYFKNSKELSYTNFQKYLNGTVDMPCSKAQLLLDLFDLNFSVDPTGGKKEERREDYSTENVSIRMRAVRKKNNLLQRDVAEILGVSTMQYCFYETKRSKIPVDILVKFANINKVPVEYFFR